MGAMGGKDVARPGQLIDPAVGDVDSEIRQLLAAHPFVTITEQADYIVTTKPDFPLDLALVDVGGDPQRRVGCRYLP